MRSLPGKPKVKVGQILSDAEIIQARRNLVEYYEGYGYPNVTIEHRLQATEKGWKYADLVSNWRRSKERSS